MKFFNEGEDSDRVASSAVMHNDPKQKKQKTSSRAVGFTNTDPFTVPNLLEGIDSRKFGSVSNDIEALCARVLQRRKSYLAMNHKSPFMYKDVEKNKGEKHSRWPFNQPAHQIVINLDDEDPVNDVKAIAPPIVISDSENEDGGDQMPYCQHKKDRDSAEIKAPREEVRSLDGEIDIGIDEEMNVGTKNDMVIEEQHHQIGTEDGGECDNTFVQKDLMDRDCVETKSPQEKVRSPSGKIDTRIDKGVHLGTMNDVVIEKSKRSDAENREERDHSFVQKDPMDMDSAETKAPREELGSRAGEIDIRIDKEVYIGTEKMPIEEGNHQTETGNGEECHPSFFQNDLMVRDCVKSKGQRVEEVKQVRDCIKSNSQRVEEVKPYCEMDIKSDKGLYVGAEDDDLHQLDTEEDVLDDIWKEMTMALECSKDNSVDPASIELGKEVGEDCDHNYVLKDDIGYVCRVCGVIERGIETIFEFQYNKVKRTRTYMYDSVNAQDKETTEIVGFKFSENDLMVTKISAHPRHMKQMKPHQVEGFNFLCSNLVADNPGGCILAHAPGSGKTFMIISFMQSFLARFPRAKPLVVLPKGILATWKREFRTWQVEDILLLDFYSLKADNRAQQLEVLKQWVEQRSILFLGYKQFSSVVCDTGTSKTSASCQEILLKAPTILILDEGHTPRNENTDVLQSLAKVQTPRKVVLSGTLYQNHVKEVFNILNLVRPKFLKLETSRAVVRRILSRVHIPGVRKHFKAGVATAFYDLVEHALQKDEDFKRKVTVIQDLREMTSKVLHYYKGDFLDELPGLMDYTVVLNLSYKQKNEVQKLKGAMKFKISSVGSAIYLHPKLNSFSDNCTTDDKMDEMLENLDMRDGVKARFFLNMLKLCESAGEKLLVFSQYLLPLKFLERLTAKRKSWSLGKEIFVISGESSSEHREWSMERFNNSPDARVFFGSIKACGEGISLVGASRVIILDVHLNPSVTRQAIGRAFRPGQKKKVFTYRLVAADSPEEEDHSTCFKKELISKMWFEWNEYNGYRNFAVETVDVQDCGDMFLEETPLGEDVKVLYRRT